MDQDRLDKITRLIEGRAAALAEIGRIEQQLQALQIDVMDHTQGTAWADGRDPAAVRSAFAGLLPRDYVRNCVLIGLGDPAPPSFIQAFGGAVHARLDGCIVLPKGYRPEVDRLLQAELPGTAGWW